MLPVFASPGSLRDVWASDGLEAIGGITKILAKKDRRQHREQTRQRVVSLGEATYETVGFDVQI